MKYTLSICFVVDLFTANPKVLIKVGITDLRCKAVGGGHGMVDAISQADGAGFEFDPRAWRDAAFGAVREAIRKNEIDPEDIVSVAVTAHPDNIVLVDENGEPSCNGLINYGRDLSAEREEILSRVSLEDIIKYTGNGFGTGSITTGAPIIMWHRKHTPEAYKNCAKLLMIKDYMAYCLSGVYATEVTDASYTMLYDVIGHKWSEEMLSALGIDPELLPPVYESGTYIGNVTPEAAAKCALSVNTRVLTGVTNKGASEYSSMPIAGGEAVYALSIFSNLLAHTEKPIVDKSGNASLFCSAVPGEYYLMCDNRTHCYAFNWFGVNFMPDVFNIDESKHGTPYRLIEELAEQSPIGSNGVIFLPFLDGEEAPVYDRGAKGVFFGVTRNTAKSDMARAVLEGVAFSARSTYEYFEALGIEFNDMHHRIIGSQPLMAQILADVTARPVKQLGQGGAGMGANILGCIDAGTWSSLKEATAELFSEGAVNEPDAAAHEKYEKIYSVYKALYPALKDVR